MEWQLPRAKKFIGMRYALELHSTKRNLKSQLIFVNWRKYAKSNWTFFKHLQPDSCWTTNHIIFKHPFLSLTKPPWITCVQYRGGCSLLWGISLSTVGVFSTMGNIMSTVGVILSTVRMLSTMGVSWCIWGISWVPWECSVPWGYSNNERFSPTCIMISPRYWVSPRYSR